MDFVLSVVLICICGLCLAFAAESSPPILDSESVGNCDRFTMTCAVASLREASLSTTRRTVLWIAAYRELDNKKESVLATYPPLSLKLPVGRDWDIRAKGNAGDLLKSDLKLILGVNDATCGDAGLYYCKMKTFEAEQPIISSKFTLARKPPYHLDDKCGCGEFDTMNKGPPIVNKNIVGTGDNFTVGCNYTSFADQGHVANRGFTEIEMTRSTASGGNATIGQYAPFAQTRNDPVIKNIPRGRNWEITAEGGNSPTNKKSIHMILNVFDASCDDAGIYTCKVKVEDSPTVHTSTPFHLYAKYNGSVYMKKINVIPKREGSVESFFEETNDMSFHYIGDNITMECTYYGEQHLKTRWATSKGSYLENAKHFPPTQTKDDHGCPTHFHRSIYSFKMSASDDQSFYYCVAMKGIKEAGVTKIKLSSLDEIPTRAVIDKDAVGNNDTFTMTCNAASFTDVDMPLVSHFKYLAMAKEVDHEEDMFAMYGPFGDNNKDEPFIDSHPDHRKWEFQHSGGNARPNRADISVTVLVKDASCKDTGLYYCIAGLPGTTKNYKSTPFRLEAKFKTTTSVDYIQVTPDMNVTVNESYNIIGENVTMECTFRGLSTLQGRWSSSKHSEPLSGLNTSPPIIIIDTDQCRNYLHKSVYRFTTSASDHGVTYRCAVYKGDHEEAAATMTFLIDLKVGTTLASATPVGEPESIDTKHSFTVTCDSTMFEDGHVIDTKQITGIGVVRHLPDMEDNLIAMYLPLEKEAEQIEAIIPEGRQWTFQTSGANDSESDQVVYMIKMTVSDALCDDFGPYKCSLKLSQVSSMMYSPLVFPKGYFPPECMTVAMNHFSSTKSSVIINGGRPSQTYNDVSSTQKTTTRVLLPLSRAGYDYKYILFFGLLSLLIVSVIICIIKVCKGKKKI